MRLPRSQTPIWKILRQSGCIAQDHRRKPKPLELRQPGEEVQLDLKDASSVPADPDGKRQHVVEVANFVDAGTSIWLHREVGADFDAETLLEAVAQFLREYGLPAMLTFDHDPRFVGSPSGRDFPSALVRFLLCVGVDPNIIPPQRPDKNAYVERFHRTLSQECLLVHLPRTREQVHEATETFLAHYNDERPNQARSCGNRPPRVACLQFPTLPSIPENVDPDRWLRRMHQRTFARTVQADGGVSIDHREYYVGRQVAGQRVTCVVQAARQQFDIWHGASQIKQLPIKGLHGTSLPCEEYVALMKQEARSEYRRYLQTRARYQQGRLWA